MIVYAEDVSGVVTRGCDHKIGDHQFCGATVKASFSLDVLAKVMAHRDEVVEVHTACQDGHRVTIYLQSRYPALAPEKVAV